MKVLLMTAIAFLIGLTACGNKKKTMNTSPNLRDTITIAYGETVQIANEQLLLKLVDVAESRCPQNVNCIRAGEAITTIQIEKGGESDSITLEAKGMCHETDGSCSQAKKMQGYKFHLMEVTPYPGTGPKGKENIKIRIVVDKTQS